MLLTSESPLSTPFLNSKYDEEVVNVNSFNMPLNMDLSVGGENVYDQNLIQLEGRRSCGMNYWTPRVCVCAQIFTFSHLADALIQSDLQ